MSEQLAVDREMIAEIIMGWHGETTNARGDQWFDEGDFPGCDVVDWRPDTDLSQAMMVAERLNELGWNIRLELPIKGQPSCYANNMNPEPSNVGAFASMSTLEQSIFDVALQIARAMEEKE